MVIVIRPRRQPLSKPQPPHSGDNTKSTTIQKASAPPVASPIDVGCERQQDIPSPPAWRYLPAIVRVTAPCGVRAGFDVIVKVAETDYVSLELAGDEISEHPVEVPAKLDLVYVHCPVQDLR